MLCLHHTACIVAQFCIECDMMCFCFVTYEIAFHLKKGGNKSSKYFIITQSI